MAREGEMIINQLLVLARFRHPEISNSRNSLEIFPYPPPSNRNRCVIHDTFVHKHTYTDIHSRFTLTHTLSLSLSLSHFLARSCIHSLTLIHSHTGILSLYQSLFPHHLKNSCMHASLHDL